MTVSNKEVTIWWDLDNTLLNSTKEIVRQFNNKHNQNNDWKLTKKWNFTDVCEGITNAEVNEMFGSKEFFDNVEFTELIKVYFKLANGIYETEYGDEVDVLMGIISKGNESNLYYKENQLLNKIPYDRKKLESDTTMDKSSINGEFMLIDDNQDCLLTCGCKYKVLYAPFGKCEWNEKIYDLYSEESGVDIVSSAKELYQYILYALKKENIQRY